MGPVGPPCSAEASAIRSRTFSGAWPMIVTFVPVPPSDSNLMLSRYSVFAWPNISSFCPKLVVAASNSFTEALRRLGMRPAGGNYATLRRYLQLWSIPTDHFDPDAARRVRRRAPEIPLEDVLTEHSTYARHQLKKRLYREGLKA